MSFSTSQIVAGPYVRDGVAYSFPFSFRALSEGEVRVVSRDADDVDTVLTGYDVSGVLNPTGGSVVFNIPPPISDSLIYVLANPAVNQEIDLEDQSSYSAKDIEIGLDRAMQRLLVIQASLSGDIIVAPSPGGSTAWADITGKPATFAPSAHTHAIGDVTGLTAGLDAKANVDLGNVTGATMRAKALASGAVVTAAGAGAIIPAFAGNSLKALRLNAGETAFEFYVPVGGGGGTGTVDSVNGQGPDVDGNVVLTAANVGAANTGLSNTAITLSTGEAMSMVDLESHRVSVLKFIPVALHAAIRDRTSTTSVTAYIQEALNYLESVGGGVLYFPAGVYRHTTTAFIPSRVVFKGDGAGVSIIKWIAGSWDASALLALGSPSSDYRYCGFLNKNWLAGAVTDQNIGIIDMELDGDNLPSGASHNWLMRMVNRPVVRNSVSRNTTGSAWAHLATVDSVQEGSQAYNCYNSGFDNWDGHVRTRVLACVVDGCSGQGIQGSGTGGFYEDRTATDFLVMGCVVRNVHAPSNFGVGIISNALDLGSRCHRAKFIGNTVEACDIGMALGGLGSHHLVADCLIKGAITQSFIVQDESPGGTGETPSEVVIDGLTIVDPQDSAEPASVVFHGGAKHIIRGLSFLGTAPARRIWLAAATSGVIVEPVTGNPGGVADLDQGSGNTFYAYGTAGGGGGGSAYVVAGSDGTGPYVDYKSQNAAYRWRVRDNATSSFNGAVSSAGNFNVGGDLSVLGGASIAGQLNANGGVWMGGVQILHAQSAAIANMTGAESLLTTQVKVNEILNMIRYHGLIAP